MSGALKKEGYSDYLLKPVTDSVWITVDNISVYIIRRAPGIVDVELLPLNEEGGDPIDGCYGVNREDKCQHLDQ